MIRLVQRKLILPRGDTGSFTIPVLPDFNAGDVAVFAIFNPLNKTIIFKKQVEIADNKITIQFSHNDTVNLPAGKYLWDIKAYLNPEYADGKLVNGDQIDSYYASYKLPECQIKETADDYLMADDAPTSTLSPNQLDLLSAILAELRDAVQKSQENVTHYPTIIDNYWHIWDANTGEYVNTDVKAGGVVVEGTGVGSAKTIDFSYEVGGVQHNATQTASGAGSFSEGINTIASGIGAHAQGDTSEASGINAHAEGSGTKATNYDTHAEGYYTQATGLSSHAEGSTTIASANNSHAEGSITVASGNHSHAEGDRTKASGNVSHAEGIFSTASGNYSHAENYQGEASGENSHAEGYISKATKNSAHAEGYRTEAKGNYSHSEGYETVVAGEAAHAEGHQASASKASAHAEGYHTQATNNNTHAQGYFTVASGLNSHAQGEFTNAAGKSSHAEGYYTYANGINSHSEGYATIVNGDYSHAGGYYTIASGNNQYVSGKYNIEDLNNLYAVIVGIGTYNNNRLNGYTLDWSGNGWYAGKVSVTDTTPVFDTDLTSKLYVDTMLALKADIQDIPDISGKADKVSNATSGNFASLDANGNLVDSGHKHSDYLTEHQDISGKQDVLTFDNVPTINSTNPVVSNGIYTAINNVIKIQETQPIDPNTKLWIHETSSQTVQVPTVSEVEDMISNAGYLTQHQDISGKQDTLTFDSTPTQNSINPVTSNGIKVALDLKANVSSIPTKVSDLDNDSGYLTSHQDITGKTDKVVNAINGNFAALDANGNLTDSGSKASDFLTTHQDISGKADKVTSATNGNFAALDANGNLTDSGHKHSDYLMSHQTIPVTDVQVNGTSVLSNGVANIPLASAIDNGAAGVVKSGPVVKVNSNGVLTINVASVLAVKNGTNQGLPITPSRQHDAAFYGLAKAAGDTTQSQSDNAVGTYTDDAKASIRTMLGAVGDTDYASYSTPGVIKVGEGVSITNGVLSVIRAMDGQVKIGAASFRPVVPASQHLATFYGLAKAAGDTTQSQSDNAVGTYTETAQSKIHEMLDAPVAVSGTDPVITGKAGVRYICGECDTLTLTPPASGIVDVTFTSGTTATVLSVPNTVKWPEWFNPNSLETSATYEISIMDGALGAVGKWI